MRNVVLFVGIALNLMAASAAAQTATLQGIGQVTRTDQRSNSVTVAFPESLAVFTLAPVKGTLAQLLTDQWGRQDALGTYVNLRFQCTAKDNKTPGIPDCDFSKPVKVSLGRRPVKLVHAALCLPTR